VTCPYKIGDRVIFIPNNHADAWSWPSYERTRLKPGDIGTVTWIVKEEYVYLDDGRGGFHWECFRLAE
jgi:ATP-dependent exoDNAse (exonuclease V) alpha subunit